MTAPSRSVPLLTEDTLRGELAALLLAALLLAALLDETPGGAVSFDADVRRGATTAGASSPFARRLASSSWARWAWEKNPP